VVRVAWRPVDLVAQAGAGGRRWAGAAVVVDVVARAVAAWRWLWREGAARANGKSCLRRPDTHLFTTLTCRRRMELDVAADSADRRSLRATVYY